MPGMGTQGGGLPGGGPPAAMTYDIDRLFRAATNVPSAGSGGTGSLPGVEMSRMDLSSDPRVEALYIAFHTMANQGVSGEDRAYLAQLVQTQTGISAGDAQKRVDDFITATLNAEAKAREAADTARKGAAEASIYTGLAMLIGAFIASVSAAIGGRLRDEHP
jgi:hypothetical protein